MASTPQVQSNSVPDDLLFNSLLSLNVYKGCAENIKMDPEISKDCYKNVCILLNIKLRTLKKQITILYDDKKPLEVYDSLDGLVDVDGVHGGIDLLRLEQNDHDLTSPLHGREMNHLLIPDYIVTDHDTAGSEVLVPYFILADVVVDCPNPCLFLGSFSHSDVATSFLAQVLFKDLTRRKDEDDISTRKGISNCQFGIVLKPPPK